MTDTALYAAMPPVTPTTIVNGVLVAALSVVVTRLSSLVHRAGFTVLGSLGRVRSARFTRPWDG
ncbi:hypothetical protein GCM10028798_09330 [Humibacter antri]